ncbi:MAG: hypothetical protein M3Q56_08380 [Bacteroidota bacterium]|nr:hypothetical protein [Bacteroidota bacterium]
MKTFLISICIAIFQFSNLYAFSTRDSIPIFIRIGPGLGIGKQEITFGTDNQIGSAVRGHYSLHIESGIHKRGIAPFIGFTRTTRRFNTVKLADILNVDTDTEKRQSLFENILYLGLNINAQTYKNSSWRFNALLGVGLGYVYSTTFLTSYNSYITITQMTVFPLRSEFGMEYAFFKNAACFLYFGTVYQDYRGTIDDTSFSNSFPNGLQNVTSLYSYLSTGIKFVY